MKKEDNYQLLSDLVKSGKTKKAFDFLRQINLDQTKLKTLSLIEAEFNQMRQAELKGIIGFEEIQIRRNRINDKLLSLLEESPSVSKSPTKKSYIKFILPILFISFGLLIWGIMNLPSYECPSFPDNFNNKILILPFENVGSLTAKPQIVLKDRINQLTSKNNLSSIAKLGSPFENITQDDAFPITRKCDANLLIWGTYSNADSLRLVMQYFFTDHPDQNNLGELITLKDVTNLQSGQMLKSLDDALFSLCGIIAIKEGNAPLAKKWFNKVKQKESIDLQMLEVLK